MKTVFTTRMVRVQTSSLTGQNCHYITERAVTNRGTDLVLEAEVRLGRSFSTSRDIVDEWPPVS